jgi:HPt (histidine-containing phosphotransfer) domain-containing protein
VNNLKMINFNKAYHITGGSSELFCQMMDLFIELAPKQLQRVEDAFDCRDYNELTAAAHNVKSSASSFGAEILLDSALKLEQSSKKNLDLDAISFMIKEVEKNINETISCYNNQNWLLLFKGDL